MKKNRILTLVMSLVLCIGMLAGCGKSTEISDKTAAHQSGEEKYNIVCTTFPQYDWVREIIGDNQEKFQLTLLLDKGVDLHSYQPTAEDIAKISKADLFIYVGGESDEWVDDAWKEATNPDKKAVNLLETIGDKAKEEEIVEGMQGEEEEEAVEEEEVEYDEHVWLSVKNAISFVETISEKIQAIDSESAQVYDKNAKDYIAKLEELDGAYENAVKDAPVQTVLFGDRFPFRYLADDYGLKYYAAFVGCSAESEASFETITFLAGKVDELGLNTIFTIEGSDQKIANTIKENTKNKNQSILEMNSLQSITSKDVDGGVTYLQVMKENLEALKKAVLQEG
ncbi:metal ABC transporter substrate-binding protein [[Clostridium] polysaccharolyticum]|uniref:Zinc transport system substrate-binding protein n=1 Tax=[Clostridium] polysaccharolyticum TaxID=29364 RepID=A0A1I0DFN5_9FIRM|nr:metal ABC transporter substrate-binding protein [[Clostridium] polysaccharolyticum]SET31176.1 zinc transport system substrate-binding protein [[Clostridium] polysaccharolyticum]